MEIVLNKKYKLVPLTSVRKDDISKLFENKRGMYVCNYPEDAWYDTNNFTRTTNYSIEKKTKFFELMDKNALLLSITQDSKINNGTKSFKIGRRVHFGSVFSGRLGQALLSIKLLIWLIKKNREYDYLLCYNFSPPELFTCSIVKFLFGKKLIVDFEDDYLAKSENKYYKYFFNIFRNIPDNVICIHDAMCKYFDEAELSVFNGFIDLNYLNGITIDKNKELELLFSGSLDEIRGVDLIPDLVKALKKDNYKFKITITGGGVLESEVMNWQIPEVRYLGFLSAEKYKKLIQQTDVCLVLQKPDHPFSQGSFPSKVEYYADQKKPILHIKML